MQLLRNLCPERFGVRNGAGVQRFVLRKAFDVGLRCKFPGRRKHSMFPEAWSLDSVARWCWIP